MSTGDGVRPVGPEAAEAVQRELAACVQIPTARIGTTTFVSVR